MRSRARSTRCADRHAVRRSHRVEPYPRGHLPTRTICWRRWPSRRRCATSRSRSGCRRRAKPWPPTARAAARACDPDQVVLSASTSEMYSWLFKLLCDAGESVLVPRPSYPLFEHLARLEGVRAEPYRLEYHGRWEIDLDSVAAAPPDTRALLLVSPNNPTGSYVERARGRGAHAAVPRSRLGADRGRGVRRLRARRRRRPSPTWPPRAGVLTFSLGGASKSLGLPQVKLGWTIVGGPDADRAAALDGLELIADTFLSVGTPVQVAAPALLRRGGGRARGHSRTRPRATSRRARRDRRRPSRLRPAAGRRRVVGRRAGAGDSGEEALVLEPAAGRAHPGAPRLLLRLRARSVSGRQPARARGRRSRRLRAHAAASRAAPSMMRREPPRRAAAAALLAAVHARLGHRRDRRHRARRPLARVGRADAAAAAADQRAAAARDVAVLGAQRDGHRPAVHLAGRRRGLRGAGRRAGARGRAARPSSRRAARRAGGRLRRRAAAQARGAAARLRAVSRHRAARRQRAGARVPRVHRGAGLVARRLRALPRAARTPRPRPWTEWPDGLRDRDPVALADARVELGRRRPLPPVSAVAGRGSVAGGAGRGRRRWPSSATCRSWWRSTAPTCGRGRTSSASTPRWACRPTRSARPGRTGTCRSTGGT